MKRIAALLKNVFYIAALIVLTASLAAAVWGIKPVVVLSGSMEPEIKTGSLAFINQRDVEVEKGDIIAFSNRDMWIAHRVVGITDGGYVTKGDSNETNDLGTVSEEQIQGTVFLWIPYLGFWLKALNSATGVIVMVTICASLMLIGLLPEKERGDNDEIQETSDYSCSDYM